MTGEIGEHPPATHFCTQSTIIITMVCMLTSLGVNVSISFCHILFRSDFIPTGLISEAFGVGKIWVGVMERAYSLLSMEVRGTALEKTS